MIKICIMAGLIALFGGCTSLPVTPYKIYPDMKPIYYNGICKGKTLSVGKVFSAHSLMLEEMKYIEQHYKEFSYSESKWANIPSESISRVLLHSIENADIFGSVSGYRSYARSDLRLETNIYNFMQYYNDKNSKSYIEISFSLSLVDVKSAKVVKSTVIKTRVKCTTPNAEGGVVALNKGLAEVLEKTNLWLSESCR